MPGYEGTVGYLQLKIANAQRQRALADQQDIGNDSGADNDVGGKALGVVQQQVGQAYHEHDLAQQLQNHLDQAAIHARAQIAMKRLGLQAGLSELDQAKIDNYRSQVKDRLHDNVNADYKDNRDERKFQAYTQIQQLMAEHRAAGLDTSRLNGIAAMLAAGGEVSDQGRPVIDGHSVAPPVTVAPNAISAGSPVVTASPAILGLRTAQQPAAASASPAPAAAVSAGYNPPVGDVTPSDPNSVRLGKKQLDESKEKISDSNDSLRDFDDVLNVLEGRDASIKPDNRDFGAMGGGIAVKGITPNDVQAGYGKGKELLNGLTGGTLGSGPNPDLEASNRRTALAQRINVPINRLLKRYGAALTETEMGRGMGEAGIQQALNGNYDVFASQLPQLIESMKYLRKKATESGQVAGQEAQTHRRQINANASSPSAAPQSGGPAAANSTITPQDKSNPQLTAAAKAIYDANEHMSLEDAYAAAKANSSKDIAF